MNKLERLDALSHHCHGSPNDREAWQELLVALHESLSIVVVWDFARRGLVAETAAPIIQDTLMRIHTGYSLRDGSMSFTELARYARFIARNLLIDQWRRDSRDAARAYGDELLDQHPSPTADPLQQILEREETSRALDALERLPLPCRDLLREWLIDGERPATIARRRGVSASGIYLRLRRCLSKLRLEASKSP